MLKPEHTKTLRDTVAEMNADQLEAVLGLMDHIDELSQDKFNRALADAEHEAKKKKSSPYMEGYGNGEASGVEYIGSYAVSEIVKLTSLPVKN